MIDWKPRDVCRFTDDCKYQTRISEGILLLNEYAKSIMYYREKQGFETSWNNMPTKLMLVVTEVSEAMEAYRKDDRDNFNEEIADAIIRLLDITASLDIDIETEIIKKMEYNKTRPYKHGKKN